MLSPAALFLLGTAVILGAATVSLLFFVLRRLSTQSRVLATEKQALSLAFTHHNEKLDELCQTLNRIILPGVEELREKGHATAVALSSIRPHLEGIQKAFEGVEALHAQLNVNSANISERLLEQELRIKAIQESLQETAQVLQAFGRSAKHNRREMVELRQVALMTFKRTRFVYNLLQPVSWATAPVLITGCGRSGTHFTAAVLRSLNLDVEHEVPAADATISWIHAPPAYRIQQGLTFERILHQHREPLASIGSILTFHERSWMHVERYLPICLDQNHLARAAKYWLYWNKLAEEQACWSFAVERLEEAAVAAEFEAQTGFKLTDAAIEAGREQHSSRRGKRGHQVVTWDDLEGCLSSSEFEALVTLAWRYGYDAPPPPGGEFDDPGASAP